MKTIFSNKELLDKEYKRLFLDRISSIKKLKECIQARYDKKELSDEIINGLFTNNHKRIYDFVGSHNENRIRHFFGDFDNFDQRDNQITVLDRFILDSVHFEVISSLLVQFNKEYKKNQEEIDKAWQKEILTYAHLGPIPTEAIIVNAIKSNKKRVFSDLQFPVNKKIQLFRLKKSSIEPNSQVFDHWIPKIDNTHESPKSNMRRNIILCSIGISAAIAIIAGIIITPFLFSAGTAASVAFIAPTLPVGIIIGLLVAISILTIAVSSLILTSNKKNPSNCNTVEYTQKSKHPPCHLSHNVLDSNRKTAKDKTELSSPYHNLEWSLSNIKKTRKVTKRFELEPEQASMLQVR
ncbi:hypothetical protein [Legionella norrlandica]|uniref:hypothetical protein n=1 Tax=Legionella norrlandica TaxID=1498499 RepID=UPI00068AC6AA|nr:hypothetical protein [Legionella norrlandica]